MNNLVPILLSISIAYVFGAFPTGYFAGRLWGVDVRRHGSGRTGGTNVLRSAGWGAFALTVFGDIGKGALAVVVVRLLFPDAVEGHALAAFFAFLGHVWSFWLAMIARPDPRVTYASGVGGTIQKFAQRGRGGAGVGTTAGALITLFPPIAVVAPVPLLILFFVRYSSVASLTTAVLGPLVMLYFVLQGSAPWIHFVAALASCALIIILHRPNIARLRAGTERKLGERLGQRPRRAAEPRSEEE